MPRSGLTWWRRLRATAPASIERFAKSCAPAPERSYPKTHHGGTETTTPESQNRAFWGPRARRARRKKKVGRVGRRELLVSKSALIPNSDLLRFRRKVTLHSHPDLTCPNFPFLRDLRVSVP